MEEEGLSLLYCDNILDMEGSGLAGSESQCEREHDECEHEFVLEDVQMVAKEINYCGDAHTDELAVVLMRRAALLKSHAV